jgi:hypothetical protein
MWLQGRVYSCSWPISFLVSPSCDLLNSWTREFIFVLRMRHPLLPNTKRQFWRIWRTNPLPNTDMCQSINLKVYCALISFALQWLQDPVNHPLIDMICPATMRKTRDLTMSLQQHADGGIVQHTYWMPLGTIWIRCLKHLRTGDKLIQISIISTLTQWQLAGYFGYWA